MLDELILCGPAVLHSKATGVEQLLIGSLYLLQCINLKKEPPPIYSFLFRSYLKWKQISRSV